MRRVGGVRGWAVHGLEKPWPVTQYPVDVAGGHSVLRSQPGNASTHGEVLLAIGERHSDSDS